MLYVNDDIVLRANTVDVNDAKFRNEAIAYRLLVGSGLPVPRVLALDESREVVPFDLMITTRLQGVSVAESWTSLNPEALEMVILDSGAMLARIHGVTFPAFGKLRELDSDPFPTWFAYFADYAGRYLAAARELNLIDLDMDRRLSGVLQRSRPLLDRVERGSLVHSDFHFENIVQNDGHVSGLLDFEWALSGDPSYDFMTGEVREGMIRGSEEQFIHGYQTVRPFDVEHQPRVDLYRLFFALEDAVDQQRQKHPDGVANALARLEDLLLQME